MITLRPTASIAFSLVLAFALAACGSSSNGKPNGSAGSNGSTGGSNGSGGSSGGGGASGNCGDVPPCLANLIVGCTPSGTCIEQMSGSIVAGGIVDNTCYSNGVKQSVSESIDSAFSATFALTVSKSGTTCFSEEGTFPLGAGGTTGSVSFNIKNGSGAVVATLTEDTATGATTVTCGGQTYTVTNMGSCGMTMPSVGGTGGTAGTSCTQGSCP